MWSLQRKTGGEKGIPLHGKTPKFHGNACLERLKKNESCRSSGTAGPQQQVIAVSAEPKSQQQFRVLSAEIRFFKSTARGM